PDRRRSVWPEPLECLLPEPCPAPVGPMAAGTPARMERRALSRAGLPPTTALEGVVLRAGGGDAIANGRGARPSAGRPPIPSPGSTSDRIGALVGAFGHARYLNVPGENLSPAVTATARRTPIGRTRMRSLLETADIARPLSAPPENPLTPGARFRPRVPARLDGHTNWAGSCWKSRLFDQIAGCKSGLGARANHAIPIATSARLKSCGTVSPATTAWLRRMISTNTRSTPERTR